MIEEISTMEKEVDSDKTVMVGSLKSVTPINGKQTGMVPKSLAEGGVLYATNRVRNSHRTETKKPNRLVRGLQMSEAIFRRPNRDNSSTDGSCVRRGVFPVC